MKQIVLRLVACVITMYVRLIWICHWKEVDWHNIFLSTFFTSTYSFVRKTIVNEAFIISGKCEFLENVSMQIQCVVA